MEFIIGLNLEFVWVQTGSLSGFRSRVCMVLFITFIYLGLRPGMCLGLKHLKVSTQDIILNDEKASRHDKH